MKIVATCPCCSRTMIRHLNHQRMYWFCRHCWQEMPDLTAVERIGLSHNYKSFNLSFNLKKINKNDDVALV